MTPPHDLMMVGFVPFTGVSSCPLYKFSGFYQCYVLPLQPELLLNGPLLVVCAALLFTAQRRRVRGTRAYRSVPPVHLFQAIRR